MSTPSTTPSNTFRIVLAMLLVVGMLGRAGLHLVGELHAADHAMNAALVAHDHDRAQAGACDGRDDATSDDAAAPYGLGGHGLFHHADGITLATLVVDVEAAKPHFDDVKPSAWAPATFASVQAVTPFRPPIA